MRHRLRRPRDNTIRRRPGWLGQRMSPFDIPENVLPLEYVLDGLLMLNGEPAVRGCGHGTSRPRSLRIAQFDQTTIHVDVGHV